jgi:DNA adenine methylase
MGSKARFAKEILAITLKDRTEGQYYVEPFVGGCNIIDKVDGLRIGADVNKYLIAMWQKLQSGWIPELEISQEDYNEVFQDYKNKTDIFPDYYKGYIGFSGSYNGRFFAGYSGEVLTKTGIIRNYTAESCRSIIQQVPLIQGIDFQCCDFRSLVIPRNSIIYCDIPYQDSTKYEKDFPHKYFWKWCIKQKRLGHQIFVSEYSAPSDFTCVWETKTVSQITRTVKMNYNTERLFTLI